MSSDWLTRKLTASIVKSYLWERGMLYWKTRTWRDGRRMRATNRCVSSLLRVAASGHLPPDERIHSKFLTTMWDTFLHGTSPEADVLMLVRYSGRLGMQTSAHWSQAADRQRSTAVIATGALETLRGTFYPYPWNVWKSVAVKHVHRVVRTCLHFTGAITATSARLPQHRDNQMQPGLLH